MRCRLHGRLRRAAVPARAAGCRRHRVRAESAQLRADGGGRAPAAAAGFESYRSRSAIATPRRRSSSWARTMRTIVTCRVAASARCTDERTARRSPRWSRCARCGSTTFSRRTRRRRASRCGSTPREWGSKPSRAHQRVLGRTQMLHVEVETVPFIGAEQKLLPDIERLPRRGLHAAGHGSSPRLVAAQRALRPQGLALPRMRPRSARTSRTNGCATA